LKKHLEAEIPVAERDESELISVRVRRNWKSSPRVSPMRKPKSTIAWASCRNAEMAWFLHAGA